MKRPTFTPAEYRKLGQQFAGFMHHCCQLRSLVSSAYPFKSPLFKALATAHDEGIFPFKCCLETLAYTEHPTEIFADYFGQGTLEQNQYSAKLPGCTAEETALLTAAKERRLHEQKRQPLSIEELKVVANFLYYVDTVCQEILDKRHALEKTSAPAAKALISPFLIIGEAFLTVSREIQRVRDEQA